MVKREIERLGSDVRHLGDRAPRDYEVIKLIELQKEAWRLAAEAGLTDQQTRDYLYGDLNLDAQLDPQLDLRVYRSIVRSALPALTVDVRSGSKGAAAVASDLILTSMRRSGLIDPYRAPQLRRIARRSLHK